MIWMNIPTAFLRSPEFVGAEPIERATWLSLLGYCCEQENGGEIALSANWKDRRWQQTCGVSLEEIETESDLWEWAGETLVLFAYPIDKEAEVKAKREGGRKGGKASAKVRLQAPDEAPCEAMLEGELEGELQRKGKERKGKEGNPCPQTDAEKSLLDEFWKQCPAQSRTRSTKRKVSDAWKRIPQGQRPDRETFIGAIKQWSNSEDWTKDGGQFAPGAHLFIKDRRWEDLPETAGKNSENSIAAFAAQHRNK